MTLTDADLVDIAAGTYDSGYAWDFLIQPQQDDGVYAGIKRFDDVDVVAFRGSITLEDWWRDFMALPSSPVTHPKLGPLHAGFIAGMDNAYSILKPHLRERVMVTGHSLGAARAVVFSGLLVADWGAPEAVVVFGEPKAGFKTLADLLSPVPVRSYRNRHDRVCDVPFTLPGFPYVHPRVPLIQLNEVGDPSDRFNPLADHHIGLYQRGIRNRLAQEAA